MATATNRAKIITLRSALGLEKNILLFPQLPRASDLLKLRFLF